MRKSTPSPQMMKMRITGYRCDMAYDCYHKNMQTCTSLALLYTAEVARRQKLQSQSIFRDCLSYSGNARSVSRSTTCAM